MTPTLQQLEQLTNEKLWRYWDVFTFRAGDSSATQADAR